MFACGENNILNKHATREDKITIDLTIVDLGREKE
jgi:hypothetical protein